VIVRRLARDHWVRLHGTPRVTVLAGGVRARRFWTEWTRLGELDATLLDASDDFDTVVREAIVRASADVTRAIAVIAPVAVIARWQASGTDRVHALVAEGLLAVPETSAAVAEASLPVAETNAHVAEAGALDPGLLCFDARSAAEAALFEALEATPATTGRFELNGRLSIRFGPDAAEVDLLSRGDAIAIEIDGYHHFADPDCYRRDRRKDLLLQTQGLLVIRLLAQDVMRDPLGSVNVVCQGLAYRRATLP